MSDETTETTTELAETATTETTTELAETATTETTTELAETKPADADAGAFVFPTDPISTNDMTTEEVAAARAGDVLAVDPDGFGFVPSAWLVEHRKATVPKLSKDALVDLVRVLGHAAELDLRRGAKTIRAELYRLRPEIAPGASDELAKLEDEAADLEVDAAAGDPLAADKLPTVRARVEAEVAAAEAYDRTVAAAFPAVPWLRDHGFAADPRHMTPRALLEALLALASSGKPLPEDLADVLDPWLGLALERLTMEERQIIATAHDAAMRAARETAKGATAVPAVPAVADDGVRFVLVERFARFAADGMVHDLQAGIVLASSEYDLAELGRQGVPLRALTSAEAKRLRGA